MQNQKTFSPISITECLNLIGLHPDAKLLAGGTDLLVRLKDQTNWPIIIDISHIEEMKGISVGDDKIIIGALTVFSDIAENKIILKNAGVLAQAAEIVGSPQIRNRATIGGNVANASPAGDSIPPLFVLNAKLKIIKAGEEKIIPIDSFFQAPGKTILEKNELIASIIIPKNENARGAFSRLGQRKSLAISKVSLAALLKFSDEKVEEARIALGAVAPTVIRAPKTEKFLTGKILDSGTITEAKKIICEEVAPISDIRSTAEYRKEMCGELLEQAIEKLISE